jgi:hypothetical protein
MQTPLVAPEIRETPSGWIAISPPGEHPRIAVIGASRDDAARRYDTSSKEWLRLRALPDPPLVHDA